MIDCAVPWCGRCGLCYALRPMTICGDCYLAVRRQTPSAVVVVDRLVAIARRSGHPVGRLVARVEEVVDAAAR